MGKKAEEKSFLDDVEESTLGAFASFMNGGVYDGPNSKTKKARAPVLDEGDDDEDTDEGDDEGPLGGDDSGEDDADDEAPKGKAKKAPAPAGLGSVLTFRHIVESPAPRRGPGRPSGSSSAKKPDKGAGGDDGK